MPYTKQLSILIVTYNSEKEIGACLQALCGFADNVEIVIVDNASSDGTAAILRTQYENNQQFRLYFNEKNTGFAEGANQAVALATAPIFLSINPDTVASVSGVMTMLEYFEHHEQIGILGPRITDEYGVPQESYGEELTPWRELVGKTLYSKYAELIPLIKKWKKKKLNSAQITSVGWIGGACFMMRKEVYQRTGGIDQQFFLSHGDLIDLSKRVRDLGYDNILYAPVSIVHSGSKSIASGRDIALRRAYIGTLYFFEKYYGKSSVFVTKVIYAVTSLLKALIAFPISFFKKEPYRDIAKAHAANAFRIITGTLGTIS